MITIQAPLVRNSEYRTASNGNAVVMLFLEGPVEARLEFIGGTEGHLAAEVAARRCKRGGDAKVMGKALTYRTDHGEATVVLRELVLATVNGVPLP